MLKVLYNNIMKEVSKIKSIITRINKKCDKENTSLSDVLKKMNISNNRFLELLGLNPQFCKFRKLNNQSI